MLFVYNQTSLCEKNMAMQGLLISVLPNNKNEYRLYEELY